MRVTGLPLQCHVRNEVDHLGARAVLGDVQAEALAVRIDAKREDAVEEPKQNEPDAERPREAHPDAERLQAELLEAAGRDRELLRVPEERDRQRPPHAGAEMDRHGSDGVVDLEPDEERLEREHRNRRDNPDDHRRGRAHDVCGRRDADQSCER